MIRVIVSGNVGEGKTTIANIIHDALKAAGIPVRNLDCHPMDRAIAENQGKAVEAVRAKMDMPVELMSVATYKDSEGRQRMPKLEYQKISIHGSVKP